MSENKTSLVPVWALTTAEKTKLPGVFDEVKTMTPQRLGELRSALAAFADSPVVTLEAHPMPQGFDRSTGIQLDALSPLARHLAELVTRTGQAAPVTTPVSTEVLYRMVVPAKVAAQVGKGLVQPMTSKAAAGGVHSALVGARGITANATFVPVAARAGTAGAAGGAAGTAAATAAGAGALTFAAPLVLMAVAVGVSAYADHQRQQAIEQVTKLLEKLHSDRLDAERAELNGCQDAIEKATSILLDRGRIGASLGLDSAVHAIDTATARARDRLTKWREVLDHLPDGAVSLDDLTKAFPGVEKDGGEFRAHLELARLAVALKRRVIVLQAVDHSQGDDTNPFGHFVRSLKGDQQRVDELEDGIATVLARLSTLQLRAPTGLLQTLMSRNEVDELMRASYRLRDLSNNISGEAGQPSDIVIGIARHEDGSILVLPSTAG